MQILHEDDDLLVLNKPAGLVCHPTRDGESSSLIGRVRLHLGHAEGRLVNRLDRETSGVVLVAKNARSASELGRLVASRGASKGYWAIVHGHVRDDSRLVDAPLGKDERSQVAIKDCVRSDGAAAQTAILVRGRFEHDGQPFTWLEVSPHTGRKHQIRIHLACIGHPLVGDKIYGLDETIYLRFVTNTMTTDDANRLILTHHALHARSVSFAWRERTWHFEAPAADPWRDWLRGLRNEDS